MEWKQWGVSSQRPFFSNWICRLLGLSTIMFRPSLLIEYLNKKILESEFLLLLFSILFVRGNEVLKLCFFPEGYTFSELKKLNIWWIYLLAKYCVAVVNKLNWTWVNLKFGSMLEYVYILSYLKSIEHQLTINRICNLSYCEYLIIFGVLRDIMILLEIISINFQISLISKKKNVFLKIEYFDKNQRFHNELCSLLLNC